MIAAAVGLARRLGRLHEDPAVVGRWRAWAAPLLGRLTPARRRTLLGLAALYIAVARPLREMETAVDVRSPGGPGAAALVVVGCFVVVVAVFVAARRFASLPAMVRARPQLWLHGLFWALVAAGWILADRRHGPVVALAGLVLALPFLLWRLGYLLLSGQRGRVRPARFLDHLLYVYPAYGGSNTPYGKGLDHLARHEAGSEEALARSQLAGLKLLILATVYDWLLVLMAGLVYAEPGGAWSAHGLGLPRVEALLKAGGQAHWLTGWAALYAALIWDVLKLAVRGHEIVGALRLFGFNIFRNTYKPLLAPSVVEFWNRYFYYFKELMVEFFFLPTYVRRFRGHPRLRMFAATLAAAGLGNLYYHLLQQDAFLLGHDWAGLWHWLQARGFYCLALSVGIYVSMRREQRRRGRAAAPVRWPARVRAIAGVWTFFALLSVWADPSAASFGQRLAFFLALFGLG
jgi:hypothetical protein